MKEKRIKVCMISTVHKPFDTRIFHKEAKSLARAGYSVYYVVRSAKEEEVDGVTIVPLPEVSTRIARMVFLPWIAVMRARKIQADVYHFHDPELMLAVAALKLITRKAVVYDIHEDVQAQILTKDWIPKSMRKPVAWLYRSVERALLRFYDAVIVVRSTQVVDYASQGRLKVALVDNYPISDADAKPPHTTGTDDRSQITHKTPRAVVYVGGLTRMRGIEELLHAAALMKSMLNVPFALKLVGPAQPPNYAQKIEERIRELGISKEVQMLGQVPHQEAMKIMREATVGVVTLLPVPNYVSTAPTKMFEYMLAGLPVVCSNFPLWQEIVTSAGCGLTVDPENPEEIANAIAYLLEHPEEAREMGRRGQRAVLTRYNWAHEEKKLLALYERLLQERMKH